MAAAPCRQRQIYANHLLIICSTQCSCKTLLLHRQRGHFAAAGLDNKRRLAEFQVTPDALLPVGTELRASHFTAGQFVDVQGAACFDEEVANSSLVTCQLPW